MSLQLESRCKVYLRNGQWVVAQLLERSLPTQDVRGSNPAISNKFILNVYCELY